MNAGHDTPERPGYRPGRPRRVGGLAPDLSSLADVIDRLYTDSPHSST